MTEDVLSVDVNLISGDSIVISHSEGGLWQEVTGGKLETGENLPESLGTLLPRLGPGHNLAFLTDP